MVQQVVGFEFDIPAELGRLDRELTEFQRNQLPFATAVTLTRTAQDAVKDFRRVLPKRFTIRNHRVQSGIQMIRAEKKDWPRPKAVVGTKDDYIARFEEGGIQRPQGNSFAIPFRFIARQRRRRGIPEEMRPAPLIDAGRARPDRTNALIRRTAKDRKAGDQSDRLGKAYLLRTRINLQPVLGMENDVVATAQSRIPFHFEREFEAAVKSARVRAGSFTSEQGKAFYWKARNSLN